MKKLFLLSFFIVIFLSQSIGQVRTVTTDIETISRQIPGFSEVRDISTKKIDYAPSQKLINNVDIEDTVVRTKELDFAESLSVNIEMKDGNITRTSDGQVWARD